MCTAMLVSIVGTLLWALGPLRSSTVRHDARAFGGPLCSGGRDGSNIADRGAMEVSPGFHAGVCWPLQAASVAGASSSGCDGMGRVGTDVTASIASDRLAPSDEVDDGLEVSGAACSMTASAFVPSP